MLSPRAYAESAEASPSLPEGSEERFSGYGVMGLPFSSGHILGLRRFTASSIGRGYTSVWHRAPSGEWTFYQDVPAEQACPRYFGPRLLRSVECPVELRWTGDDRFSVEVDGGDALRWDVEVASPASIRAMNALARALPQPLWRNAAVLRAMGLMARAFLDTGRLALSGRAPSGQRFTTNPLVAWSIRSSHARIGGVDAGEPWPIPRQDRLGDFWIPQRGLFVVGRAYFEPFDPGRHLREVRSGR